MDMVCLHPSTPPFFHSSVFAFSQMTFAVLCVCLVWWCAVLVAATLLELGASVDSRSREGLTPLHAAVEANQEEMVLWLLEQRGLWLQTALSCL